MQIRLSLWKARSNMNGDHVLGLALGRVLANGTGLTAAYLPSDLRPSVARSIVIGANMLRKERPAYSFLVSNSDKPDLNINIVSFRNAAKWRVGDHLAVFESGTSHLETNDNVYSRVLGPSFPAGTGDMRLLKCSSYELVHLLLGDASQKLSKTDRELAAHRIMNTLEITYEIYERLGSNDTAWNCQWFDHCDNALGSIRTYVNGLSDAAVLATELGKVTYAAFGLPKLSENSSGKIVKTAADIVEAIDNWWGTEEQIRTTVALLAYHSETESENHPLEAINWTDFDLTAVRVRGAFRALSAHGDPQLRLERFVFLTESQFFDPVESPAGGAIVVETVAGDSLALDETPNSPALIPTSSAENDPTSVETITIRLRIPTVRQATKAEVEASRVSIEISPRTVSAKFSVDFYESEITLLTSFVFQKDPTGIFHPKPITVTVSLPPDDMLNGIIIPTPPVILYPMLLDSPNLLVFSATNKRISAGEYHGSSTRVHDEIVDGQKIWNANLRNNKRHILATWGEEGTTTPSIKNTEFDHFAGFANVWTTTLVPTTTQEFSLGNSTFRLKIAEPTKTFISPLLAALYNTTVDPVVPQAETDSIRGVLEKHLTELAVDDSWQSSHGQFVLTAKCDIENDHFELDDERGAMVPNGMLDSWRAQGVPTVSHEVRNSPQARRFRDAFCRLDIRRFIEQKPPERAAWYAWTSQTQWRGLGKDEVEEYLNAYTELVNHARDSGSASDLFWAAYPFCFVVWNIAALRPESVLMTPLHPIRLSWLSMFEQTLAEVVPEIGERLAGIVEGWNLPIFGPGAQHGRRMMAVPMETGHQHIFAGWSLLVRVTDDPLSPPTRIAGMDAPGTSTSGLNAGAVKKSMNDFRRMNPYTTTIRIDLSSPTERARSAELDDAVIDAAKALAHDSNAPLTGGIRVMDSLNRLGTVSSSKFEELAELGEQVPIVWKRYHPDQGAAEGTNITFLQDSGVHTLLQDASALKNPLGVIGRFPLRRFEITPGETTDGLASTRPTLGADSGWQPFANALRAVENSLAVPELITRVHGTTLHSPTSEWTVSGEGMISPAALADLLSQAHSKNEHILWEWSPPFLQNDGHLAQLERRPYLSVVRVPATLRTRISERISSAIGREASASDTDQILQKLGSRGIGLSALLSIGDNHATGALGFYIVLKLLESPPSRDCERLVLPIDACDPFLLALSGRKPTQNSQQRADLLVIDVNGTQVKLTPIEIKYYGIDNMNQAAFPSETAIKDALGQLASTQATLLEVSRAALEVRSEIDSMQGLWWNAFASLIDASLRLSPKLNTPADTLVTYLQAIVNGEAQVVTGQPLLCWFEQNGRDEVGNPFITRVKREATDDFPIGYKVFCADPSYLLADPTAGTPISEAWDRLWDENLAETPDTSPRREHEESPSSEDVTETATEDAVTTGKFSSTKSSGVRVTVGEFTDTKGPTPAQYWPSNTALNQLNIGIVGDLGTGKTQFLKALISNLRHSAISEQRKPISFLIFDYKKDFQDQEFLQAAQAKVISPFQIPLNVFALTEPYTKHAAFQRARSFVEVIKRVYSGVGPVQTNRLTSVILGLFEDNQGVPPTMNAVLEAYSQQTAQADSVVSILNSFVLHGIFSEDPTNLVTFDQLIGDHALVLALSELGADSNTKNALVALFLNSYYEYMLTRTKGSYAGDEPQLRVLNSFLVVDEASNILKYEFEALSEILLQGREFGIGVILSSQYLSHFKFAGRNYGEPLHTWIIHKVPHVTPLQLSQLGLPDATPQDATRISQLQNHHAFYKTLDVEGRFIRGTPFVELRGMFSPNVEAGSVE